MSKTIKWLCVLIVTLSTLYGCKFSRRTSHRKRSGSQPEIVIHLEQSDNEPLPKDVEIIKRQWSSPRRWDNTDISHGFNLSLNIDGKKHFSTYINKTAQERNGGLILLGQSSEDLDLSFENELGIIRLSGDFKSPTGSTEYEAPLSGTAFIEIHHNEVASLENAFDETLSLTTLLRLIGRNVNPEEMKTYAECDIKIDLDQARRLATYGFDASQINQLIGKGYNFTAENFIDLARRHVPYDFIVEWKQYDESLSADQLIYARQRHLDVNMAWKWRGAFVVGSLDFDLVRNVIFPRIGLILQVGIIPTTR